MVVDRGDIAYVVDPRNEDRRPPGVGGGVVGGGGGGGAVLPPAAQAALDAAWAGRRTCLETLRGPLDACGAKAW